MSEPLTAEGLIALFDMLHEKHRTRTSMAEDGDTSTAIGSERGLYDEFRPHLLAALDAAREGQGLDVERTFAAMLDDELRRVEAGLSTPESLKRARETYARHAALAQQTGKAQQREGAG